MHEIKFRLWLENKMIEWEQMKKSQFRFHFFDADNDKWRWMQFTGILDKNGKECYEEDLVQAFSSGNEPKIIRKVLWKNDEGFRLVAIADWNKSEATENIGLVKGLKIIGNVCSNPELLIPKNQ